MKEQKDDFGKTNYKDSVKRASSLTSENFDRFYKLIESPKFRDLNQGIQQIVTASNFNYLSHLSQQFEELTITPPPRTLTNISQQFGEGVMSPLPKTLTNIPYEFGEAITTPLYKTLTNISQPLENMITTPLLETLPSAYHELGKIVKSPSFESLSLVVQEINNSTFHAPAVSIMENIVNINADTVDLTKNITSLPSYQNTILKAQETITKNSVLNDTTKNMINETQKKMTNYLKNFQKSELIMEDIIENPYEEINSEDINSTLDENTFYELYFHLQNTIDDSSDLLEQEAVKNRETRQKVDELEKDSKKLFTKKDIIMFFIGLLFNPIFQPFQEIYNEWASQPATHVIKDIKKDNNDIHNDKENYTNFKIVKKDNVEIKKEKNFTSETIGTLGLGHVVEVIDEKGDWARIKTSDYKKEEIKGWLPIKHLEKIG